MIKSGTNRVHGSLWSTSATPISTRVIISRSRIRSTRVRLTIRTSLAAQLAARYLFPKSTTGKIKPFSFSTTRGTRIVTPSPSTSYVPTLAERASGFTNFQDYIALAGGTKPNADALGRLIPLGTFLDPATTRTVAAGAVDPVSGFQNTSAAAVFVRDPFYSQGSVAGIKDFTTVEQNLNQLPANRLDPNAVKLLALYPEPTPGLTGRQNYSSFAKFTNTINQYDIRIDHNFSPKDILFGVFNSSHTVYVTPPNLPGLAEGQNFGGGDTAAPRYAYALGYTHVFTPGLSNEIHAGWTHSIEHIIPFEANTLGIPEQFGITGVPQSPGNGGLPVINVYGYSGLGVAAYVPTLETVTDLEILDNVTKVYGSQTIKMGGSSIRSQRVLFNHLTEKVISPSPANIRTSRTLITATTAQRTSY